ncbi:MAG: M18 family aminopeptidase [Lachnospiraceae bacterium]|nr:M18 family aminopeptidase [Lachnospiraceae bacterium]
MEYISELMEFLDNSLTSYHTVQNVQGVLLREGFTELSEREIWKLETGGRYFVVRNDSSIMAFCIPACGVEGIKGYHIYAAHSDSPAFKIKESPEIQKDDAYVSVNTEKYGGMILSTWFDRPLVIAGRVCVENDGKLKTYPIQLKENTCLIPSLAIHMNREANNGTVFSAQNDMMPLLGMTGNANQSSKGMIKAMLVEALNNLTGGNYHVEDILSYDLFVENGEKAVLAGADNEFIMTPRYDDLACVFAGLKGIMHAKPDNYIDVLAVFDNEEVGSLTRQGADSTFMRDTLENIADGLESSANTFRTWIADSFMLSADNAHACHPNQGGKADLTNRPYLNKGVVLKYHGGQKYATDAYSAAYVRRLCSHNDIPLQTYANHSDIPGGSTLGNLAMAQVSMAAADIGLPQLSMHSACETAGTKDIEYLIQLAKAFYKD